MTDDEREALVMVIETLNSLGAAINTQLALAQEHLMRANVVLARAEAMLRPAAGTDTN